jgi:aldose 1-epimerase
MLIEKKSFAAGGINQYTLGNDEGASVSILDYGGIVTHLNVPDKAGKLGDVVLGFDAIEPYQMQSPYFGAIIGRVGNRIAHGMFSVEGRRFCTPINNGPNSLHGGFLGYDKRMWIADTAVTPDGPSLRLTLTDPDGSEGFPGTVAITVIYSLTSGNALKIQYYATTDQPTPINLTNHSYFNLKDAGKSDVLGHEMKVYGQQYVPVDATLIPTGQLAPLAGSAIDFRSPKPIGRDLIAMGGDPAGYDHCIVLDHPNGSLGKAVEVYEPETGRFMTVWTTEPGVQFYSGNFLNGSIKGKGGTVYRRHAALALECEHFPDAVNHPEFPETILRPGEVYRQVTEYRFTALAERPW